jgi:hypothetical protein
MRRIISLFAAILTTTISMAASPMDRCVSGLPTVAKILKMDKTVDKKAVEVGFKIIQEKEQSHALPPGISSDWLDLANTIVAAADKFENDVTADRVDDVVDKTWCAVTVGSVLR